MLRPVLGPAGATARLEKRGGGLAIAGEGEPGSAWVYADAVREQGGVLVGPYLDNRAGVWIALRALQLARDVVVAFTTGEEHSGRGALIAACWLVERYGVRQAIISDITWDTAHVHCGSGPAISLRDRFVPRRTYLARVLAIAARSGLPHQIEVESDGSSDGGWMERSGFPIDWVFVGPPEKRPHTSREELSVADLLAAPELIAALVAGL
jgi:putative aminopeptidase FrvX